MGLLASGEACVCGDNPFSGPQTCLQHYGEQKRDLRRSQERPYRKGRYPRKRDR